MTHLRIFAVPLLCLLASTAMADDWTTRPSFYTHDPNSGQRVYQYSKIGPVYVFQRGDYVESGYRHNRSTIAAGGSVDNLHIVEEWGRPVRPYDEWRFPYRPYSVPYGLWGPQNYGYGVPYGNGYGFPGGGGGQVNPYGPGVNGNGPQPWFDGHYPTYDRHDRAPYYFPYGGRYNSSHGFGGADGQTGVGPP